MKSGSFFFLSALGAALAFLMLELVLRGLKSYRFDGAIHLSSSSVNNEFDPEFGWRSPPGLSYFKTDSCYGTGVVSYNSAGFRGAPMEEMQPGKVLCLIGDSTMQAYQMPDGLSLGALLETRARKDIDPELRVLALAVGGYGSLQEEMLYERYCRALAPRAVVWAWNENDPANNDYVAERYFNPSSNNMRRRPYLENGAIVIRKPYRLQLFGLEEQSILLRLVNASLLNLMPGAPPYGAQEAERRGFAVAESILTARAAELGNKFILLAGSEARGITDFSKSSGITTVVVPPFSAEEVCMPRDSHPNELGHRKMLEVLWPVLKSRL